MGFIQELHERRLLPEWVSFIDLLMGNEHFPPERGWNKQKITKYTKEIKGLPDITMDNWIVGSQKDMMWNRLPNRKYHVWMVSDGKQGRSLLRHIRNSIAHGHSSFMRYNGIEVVCFKDYLDNTCKKQTADILIPYSFFCGIRDIYVRIKESTYERSERKHKPSRKPADKKRNP